MMAKKTKTMPPIHPGETLREDFLKPLGLTANRLAIEDDTAHALVGDRCVAQPGRQRAPALLWRDRFRLLEAGI